MGAVEEGGRGRIEREEDGRDGKKEYYLDGEGEGELREGERESGVRWRPSKRAERVG